MSTSRFLLHLVHVMSCLVILLCGCPRGNQGEGILGLPCQCDEGSSQCDADLCEDLSCVDGLCSLSCDLGVQDCLENFYCTTLSTAEPIPGAWCRPVPICLGEAGLDDESLLMASGVALGPTCVATGLGEASVSGEAFGVSFPSESQGAVFHELDPDATFGTMIHIGAEIEISEVSGMCRVTQGDVALTVTLPCGALRLGSFEVGAPIGEGEAVTVEVLTPTNEGVAVSGTVLIEGYDPVANTLCGSVDVTFNDGFEGRLLGLFQATELCQ